MKELKQIRRPLGKAVGKPIIIQEVSIERPMKKSEFLEEIARKAPRTADYWLVGEYKTGQNYMGSNDRPVFTPIQFYRRN